MRFVLTLFLLSITLCAATFTSPTASRTDVLATIALTSPGDTVIVPADTGESWAGDINITGISLIGAGTNASTGTVITTGTVILTKHATAYTKMVGFRFTGNTKHFAIGGTISAKAFVIGNCYFFNAGAVMASSGTNGGLFYDCIFDAPSTTNADVWSMSLGGTAGSDGDLSWQAAQTMGTADTTGESNIYFEDCEWNGFLEAPLDVDNGTRVVIRYCTFNDSSVVLHGGGSGSSGNDTSAYGGRHFEIYNCEFNRIDANVPINKWVWMRGSSGVFVSNAVDEASSGMFPNKPELRFTVGCPGAYPRAYQFGQSSNTGDATPDHPYIILGNTGAGASSGNFITIGENPLSSCGTPGDYIQSGRDYVTSNTWGWTAYQYPHPLNPASVSAAVGNAYGSVANVGTLRSP